MPKDNFDLSDVEISWNGVTDEPWFDLTLHDDELPTEERSIVSTLSVQPADFRKLIEKLEAEEARYTAHVTAQGSPA